MILSNSGPCCSASSQTYHIKRVGNKKTPKCSSGAKAATSLALYIDVQYIVVIAVVNFVAVDEVSGVSAPIKT